MSDIHAEIARAQTRPTVQQTLAKMQPDLTAALPPSMKGEEQAGRVMRLALTEIRKSEMAKQAGKAKRSLSDCTPESFAGALLTAVALGLEPGVNGEAYLIPYGAECTLVLGYQGLAKLYWQHPLARHLDAQAVHENDQFDYELGLHPFLAHKPAHGERGRITHYYAVASLATGAEKFEVMTADEVAAVRQASPRRSDDIDDPQHWMERKTVLRQLLKLMPKSTRLRFGLDTDEQGGTDLVAQRMPAQIIQAAPPAITDGGDLVDQATGEIRDPEPPAEQQQSAQQPPRKTSPGRRRGKGSPDPGPSDSGEPSGGGRDRPQPSPGPSGEAGGGAARAAAADPPGKISNGQRSALMAHWTRLRMMNDREERLLVTTQLLGLEPGAIDSTSELGQEQASRLLDMLAELEGRDDLDKKLAGQPSLPGGGS